MAQIYGQKGEAGSPKGAWSGLRPGLGRAVSGWYVPGDPCGQAFLDPCEQTFLSPAGNTKCTLWPRLFLR